METFDWSHYLDLVGGTRVPAEGCLHVEESLRSRLSVPCLAEVEWEDGHFWACTVWTVCGPLLELSYLTPTDSLSSPKFWLDTSTRGVFSFRHSGAQQKVSTPLDQKKVFTPPNNLGWPEPSPEVEQDWYKVIADTVKSRGVTPLTEDFSPNCGFCPADSLRPGMKFEWRDLTDPTNFWGVTVTVNRGGLLGLAYDSPQLKQTETDFSCFYTDNRLQPCGTVAARPDVLRFAVPQKLQTCGYPDQVWKVVRQSFREIEPDKVGPSWCFPVNKRSPSTHNFEEKMLLTIIDPTNKKEFRVGVVEKTFDQFNFLISLLEEPQVKVVCRGDSEDIVPISWAIEQKFLNKASLQNMSCSPLSKIAGKNIFLAMGKHDSRFETGQWFEFCEDFSSKEFCIGSVLERKGHILSVEILTRTGKKCILVSERSLSIFPVGWCEANGVELFTPDDVKILVCANENDLNRPPEDQLKEKPTDLSSTVETNVTVSPVDSSWCPPIFFNHLCYSASFLSRHRLETLPQSLGPGPVRLVMREVLARLIGSSFKSGAVLKKLEVGADMRPRPDFWLENMKGKSRVLMLQAEVEIPSKTSQVSAFCREVCQKLACCPYLFGPQRVGEECPSACNTRPKSDFQVGNETGEGRRGRGFKRGRKRGKSNNLTGVVPDLTEQSTPGTGNVSGQSSSSTSPSLSPSCSTTVTTNTTRDNSPEDQPASKRRNMPRNWGEILPPSEIRTRGAKLPNFGLQLKVRPSRKDVEVMERIIAEKCREEEDKSPPPRPPSPKLLRSKSAPQALLGKTQHDQEVTPHKTVSGLEPAFTMSEMIECPPCIDPPPIRQVNLGTNPLLWTVQDVAEFVAKQQDISHMSPMFLAEEVDGQALLLLNLPTVLEHWRLRLREAVMVARSVESVKLAFYKQFVFGGQTRREWGPRGAKPMIV